jgi:lysophospholipase L1-like esterase
MLLYLAYFAHLTRTLFRLPALYRQGNRVKKEIPILKEASGPQGRVLHSGSKAFQLLTLGESTIASPGMGSHERGFTGNLARQLARQLDRDVTWRVYAQGGLNARKVRERLFPWIAEKDADLIVIALGGNDAFEFCPIWKWQKEIRALCRGLQARFPGVPIAFTNMPPVRQFPAFTPLMQQVFGDQMDLLRMALAEWVERNPDIYFNAEPTDLEAWQTRHGMKGATADFFSDGVHPSALTYEVWAKDFVAFLLEQKAL